MTVDEKRAYLKAKGWRREDRRNVELWVRPGLTTNGYQHLGVSLRAAVTAQKKKDADVPRTNN